MVSRRVFRSHNGQKCVGGRGSAADPVREAYRTPPDPYLDQGREGEKRIGGGGYREGRAKRCGKGIGKGKGGEGRERKKDGEERRGGRGRGHAAECNPGQVPLLNLLSANGR